MENTEEKNEPLEEKAEPENREDPYKDYYTTNIFEGLKKANPRVLTVIGILAIAAIVAILLFAGGS